MPPGGGDVERYPLSGVPSKPTTSAGPPSSRRGKTILVVDDDPQIASMLQKILGRFYEVALASDGPSAVAAATSAPHPALIVLDVMMPGMDGFTVAKQLRLKPETAKIPILFVTARDTPMDVIRGIQSGARAYITKPFKIDDVVARVKAILG
jgi:putative two-component system response regulator